MATPPTKSGWSYSEFARLPSDDGNRYEVIEGELYVTPSPRSLHQAAVTALTAALGPFVEEHGLGRVLARRRSSCTGSAAAPRRRRCAASSCAGGRHRTAPS